MTNSHLKTKKLSGWGNYPSLLCNFQKPNNAESFLVKKQDSLIARGQGRSYGDSSFSRNLTLGTQNLTSLKSFDEEKGIIISQSGLTVDKLLPIIVPKGWFLPASPGTKFVSIGGMVASDVHGKNHHKEGSFGNHVIELKILLSNDEILICNKDLNSDLFWATIGGMGLTGIILEVTFKLKKINSYKMKVDTLRANNLKEAMSIFEKGDHMTYSVAWIDCLASGRNLGRSLIFSAEHYDEELNKIKFLSKKLFDLPIFLPRFFLNRFFVKTFNFLYFLFNVHFKKTIIDCDSYFYPLDNILNWNKLYGKKGFMQYQCYIPKKNSYVALKEILKEVSKSKSASFLAVLKLFGPKNSGILSFPDEGFTLAMDFQNRKETFDLLNILDEIVIKNNGRLYLSKDSRLSSKNFRLMNYDLSSFTKIREKYNSFKFCSEQSRRLEI